MHLRCWYTQEIDNLIGKVVRAMLFAQFEKSGVPVARSHLNTIIMEDYKEATKARKLSQVCEQVAAYHEHMQ